MTAYHLAFPTKSSSPGRSVFTSPVVAVRSVSKLNLHADITVSEHACLACNICRTNPHAAHSMQTEVQNGNG